MSGNTENARLWNDADVYIATDLNATVPADAATPFNGSWSLVGLLSGDDGFTESREEETSDQYGWGGILIRTSRRNFKFTKKFSALEDNAVTRAALWPGSPAGKLVVPRPVPVKVAFETRDGLAVRRLITRRYAEITVDGDVSENETDLTKYELLATIFPNAAGELFDEQKSSGIVPVITAATPSNAAAGAAVTITGRGFSGASLVKFGAVNASMFTVDSSTQITAIVPPGAAGAAAITVTAPSGTSAAFAYTRG